MALEVKEIKVKDKITIGTQELTNAVTSVGITPGTGISVSGSPITSSGSITVTNSAPHQATNLTWTAGTTAGPTINSSTGTGAVIPSASETASGVVTTGEQTFLGLKNFSNNVTVNGTLFTSSIGSDGGVINAAVDNFNISGGSISADTTVQGSRLISTVATGTSPLTVTSTTAVTNLNADLLDGQHGSYYAPINTPTFTGTVNLSTSTLVPVSSGTTSASITFNTAQAFTGPYLRGQVQDLYRGYYTAQYKIWDEGNDGSGSGLDADTLDGNQATAFATASHTHAATDITSGTIDSARLGDGLLGVLEVSFFIGRIWSRPYNSHTWTLRRDVTTPTAVTSNTATFTQFALGYTPTTGASGDVLKIELSLGSSTAQQEKVFVEVTCATNQSTAGMALLSADGYAGVSSNILQVYRYYAQYRINGSNLEVRYPTEVRIA
jgi:hypothetical protein